MKMVDIEYDRILINRFIIMIGLTYIFVEKLPGIQLRESILLRAAYDALILVQLDDALAPGFDHFRAVIGFCDKIIRPHFNASDLCRLFRSHYDHRDPGDLFLFFMEPQELFTAHNGHQQIQEDQ